MLKTIGHNLLIGLVASALLNVTAPVFAGENKGPAYLLDSAGAPVISGTHTAEKPDCVVTPAYPKDKMFEICGDKKEVASETDPCAVDVDGDGVPGDGVVGCPDKCPGTPADTQVDANGCAVVSMEVKTTLSNDEVNFDFDKFNLKPTGKVKLDKLVEFINGDLSHVPDIAVVGHTDSAGTESYNQKLSERRAQAVANYLRTNGVPASLIMESGKGELAPVADNKTKAGRAQNRRVEITIRKTNKQ